MKVNQVTEGLVTGQDGKLYECEHPKLSIQARDVAQGKQVTKGDFIICDICKEIVAFLPRRSKPTQNPLQVTINQQREKIAQLERDLANCKSGKS
jgi:hypothetical protein